MCVYGKEHPETRLHEKVKGFQFSQKLDIEKMREAIKYFIGKHDFSAFKSSGTSSKNSIREIYKAVNKLNGNFYLNNNIILNTKYDLMREIGYNNYFIDEDIKHKFDPNYVLNPHLCFPKPKFFEFLKRQSRIWNYLFTKVKI